MATTHADVEDGERIDVSVEFVTRRPVDAEGELVHRLIVADGSGERFPVLVAPDSAPVLDLRTGATYRFVGLLSASSVVEPGDVAAACPNCGGGLRTRQSGTVAGPAVARAASRLGLHGPFGVVDARTTVERASEDAKTTVPSAPEGDGVDDWVPMGGDARADTPDYVCESCGSHVRADELRDDHGSDGEVVGETAAPPTATGAATTSPRAAGLAAGGAKEAADFRESVGRGYTPRPEAVGDEGLFHDYRFETGERDGSDALFAPRCAAAASDHPITGTTERYLSVGLDSTLATADFERPRLDLVAVLDVSGSMDGPVDAYYDEHGPERRADAAGATKLEAATESLCALTEQLRDDDRLGVVLFDHRTHVAKPLRDVGTTDMRAIRRHVRDVAAGGSTNLADGFEAAVDMLVDGVPDPGVERRVVLVTDVMPSSGAAEDGDLTRLFADAATEGVHTTFVGVGVDANAELADALSGIRGANHYFVQSATEFERRLDEEFDYMVTPLVYDLAFELEAEGYEIEAVHGSPSADAVTGRLVHVGTLFPSAKREGDARGGVVLVRLERTGPDDEVELVASWTERDGGEHTERVDVAVPEAPEAFAHEGVRKAVALARYARELRNWARAVHDRADSGAGVEESRPGSPGRHERGPVPLVVPHRYADRFDRLRGYLEDEVDAVGDGTLQREVDLLATLCRQAPATPADATD